MEHPKYKFCLSVTLTVAIATLLLRSACHFFEGKIARNDQYQASDLKQAPIQFVLSFKLQPNMSRNKEVRNFKGYGSLRDVIFQTFLGYFEKTCQIL